MRLTDVESNQTADLQSFSSTSNYGTPCPVQHAYHGRYGEGSQYFLVCRDTVIHDREASSRQSTRHWARTNTCSFPVPNGRRASCHLPTPKRRLLTGLFSFSFFDLLTCFPPLPLLELETVQPTIEPFAESRQPGSTYTIYMPVHLPG